MLKSNELEEIENKFSEMLIENEKCNIGTCLAGDDFSKSCIKFTALAKIWIPKLIDHIIDLDRQMIALDEENEEIFEEYQRQLKNQQSS